MLILHNLRREVHILTESPDFVPMEVLISSFKLKIPMALDFFSHMQKIWHLDTKLDMTESDITKTETNVHTLKFISFHSELDQVIFFSPCLV